MDPQTNEISINKGSGAKERGDLRRPYRHPCTDQHELDPCAGGDRPTSAVNSSTSNSVENDGRSQTTTFSSTSFLKLCNKDRKQDDYCNIKANECVKGTKKYLPTLKSANDLGAATSQLCSKPGYPNYFANANRECVGKTINSENLMNSTLSPLAEEFVPRSQLTKTTEVSANEGKGLSPYAEEFIPRSTYKEPPEVKVDEIDEFPESYAVMELKSFLFEITYSPEKFDQQLRYLTEILNEWISDGELNTIVDLIFDASVLEPNFRYNGAKLCSHLSKHLRSTTESGKFRTVLLNRCQQEHSRHKELALNKDKHGYLRGYALFMAELYSQLEVSGGNVSERIVKLGKAILEILDTLLGLSAPEHLKCACQILKCVGAYLENQEKASGTDKIGLDSIFSKLQKIKENDSYSRDIKMMLLSVLELRAHDWGQSVSPAASTCSEPIFDSTKLNEPVFYGPDGLPITPEETLFLESQRYSPDFPDIDEFDDDDLYGNEEMDETLQEAYEEYLRTTGQ